MIFNFFTNPFSALIFFILLLLTITIHEYSHAKVADYLGDPTPRLFGRLSLNPFSHIDMVGLLFLIFFGFGWGKPVPIDAFNLRHPRKDTAIISLAGPLSNFIVAILSSFLLKMIIFFKQNFLFFIGYNLLPLFIYLNLVLGIFNLLPFFPLDGFKIVGGFLSSKQAQEWYQLERYGIIFLFLFIFPIGQKSMSEIFLKPLINFFYQMLV